MNSRTATEAASTLNLSQPGVSKALGQLEDQLGIILFERIKGRLYATPEAKTLYPEVNKIFGVVDAVARLAEDMRDVKSGIVCVAAIPTFANVLLPKVIARVREQLPNVRISMQVLPSLQIVDEVLHGHVDLGFVHDSVDIPTIRSEDLLTCDIVAILPIGHPLQDQEYISFENLEVYPVVCYPVESPFSSRVRKMLKSTGRDFVVTIDVGASSALLSVVENGAGIGLIEPFALFGNSPPNVIVKPLESSIPIRPRLLYPLYRPLSSAARYFVSQFKSVVQEETAKYSELINLRRN